ncbi:MAG: hypothetical protein AB2L18_11140 [Anaerolineaceae bacterium]
MNLEGIVIPKIDINQIMHYENIEFSFINNMHRIANCTQEGLIIKETLRNDARVKKLETEMIISGDGYRLFEIDSLVIWFIWYSNKYGKDSAINALEDYLNSDEIVLQRTLWIIGVQVDTTMDLGDGYLIKSINELPDSLDRFLFQNRKFDFSFARYPTPECVITKDFKVKKISKEPYIENRADLARINNKLIYVSMLLNVLHEVACLPFWFSYSLDEKIPPGIFFRPGGGYPLYDLYAQDVKKISIELKDDIKKIINAYESYEPSEKKRFDLILSRLSQAKRHEKIEDKILDLGIALEMLLLDDPNKYKEQVSLSFRIRGSWFLGDSYEKRIDFYKDLNNIYKYRSQVAHSGILCKGNVNEISNVEKSFVRYQTIAEKICQKMILDGKQMWDDLTLGKK